MKKLKEIFELCVEWDLEVLNELELENENVILEYKVVVENCKYGNVEELVNSLQSLYEVYQEEEADEEFGDVVNWTRGICNKVGYEGTEELIRMWYNVYYEGFSKEGIELEYVNDIEWFKSIS